MIAEQPVRNLTAVEPQLNHDRREFLREQREMYTRRGRWAVLTAANPAEAREGLNDLHRADQITAVLNQVTA